MNPSRRTILRAGASAAAVAATPTLRAQSFLASSSSDLIARSGKRRVVIAGGGWGGLTAARYLRDLAPDLEVVLLERNPLFWSCPMSNKWLIDVLDTSYLVHSYSAPSARLTWTVR